MGLAAEEVVWISGRGKGPKNRSAKMYPYYTSYSRRSILDQPPLFPVPEKIKKQPPTHVVVVHWISGTLTILAQTPVPHACKTQRRVLFVNHKPGRVPQLEAIRIARSIAKKNRRPDTILV